MVFFVIFMINSKFVDFIDFAENDSWIIQYAVEGSHLLVGEVGFDGVLVHLIGLFLLKSYYICDVLHKYFYVIFITR